MTFSGDAKKTIMTIVNWNKVIIADVRLCILMQRAWRVSGSP
jgi:hypothetical protein